MHSEAQLGSVMTVDHPTHNGMHNFSTSVQPLTGSVMQLQAAIEVAEAVVADTRVVWRAVRPQSAAAGLAATRMARQGPTIQGRANWRCCKR